MGEGDETDKRESTNNHSYNLRSRSRPRSKVPLPLPVNRTSQDFKKGHQRTFTEDGTRLFSPTGQDTSKTFSYPLSYNRRSTIKEFVISKVTKSFMSLVVIIGIFITILVTICDHFQLGFPILSSSVLVSLCSCIYLLKTSIVKESVLAITSFGVQINHFSALGTLEKVLFIPKSNIKAIVIIETIRMQRVISYLALMLNSPDSGGKTTIPLFLITFPRMAVLQKIYSEIHHSIMGHKL